jgi:hypothetical protein
MKRILSALGFALLAVLSTNVASAKDTRVFEMRTYYAAEGKLPDLLTRFRDHTCSLFEKHGIVNIGYFVPVDNVENKLVYFIAFPDLAAHDKSWKEFMADPDWKAAAKASEANGKLVTKVVSVFLDPTDYSPMITPAKPGSDRLFELRTYTTPAGRLDNLNARFRDHTCTLFEKHGITNFAYWTVNKDQKGAEEKGAGTKLVYIIIHKDQAAATASWKDFIGDPVWVAAKNASEKEAGGSLTLPGKEGVVSLFMKPVDFSQTK